MRNDDSPLFHIANGEMVVCGDKEYMVVKPIDLAKVLARNVITNETEVLEIKNLAPWKAGQVNEMPTISLDDLDPDDFAEASHRLEIIKPLLRRNERGSAAAQKIAKEAGVSVATLYRWLKDYLNSGLLSALIPAKRGAAPGGKRISEDVEAIIKKVLDDYHFTDKHPSLGDTAERIWLDCHNANLPKPHIRTIKKRIEWRGEREKVVKRLGRRVAEQILDPNEGSVPNANWPLAMCQIDHTPMPVIIVHDIYRTPINRAWLTLCIDVYSRIINGMYVSLESPSAMSAGMCLSHAILPKEKWLAEEMELPEVEWSFWGVMGILHMDNAREFRGDTIKAACLEYGIDPQFRPVKKPRYGGHIERLMGTASTKLQKLQGATFPDPKQRFEYDSEGRAIMTMHELEQWLTLFIAKYHRTPHEGLNDETPLERYRKGLLGGDGKLPRGLPARRLDEEKVRIDFMPIIERTVQSYGVAIDDIHYFADVLRPWVNSLDPKNPKLKRVFNFRRDPHDISRLYFFEPNAKRYFVIPMRDASLGPISLWEAKAGHKAAKDAGVKEINERIIYEFSNKQREIETKAAEKTKSARREDQRRRNHEKQREKRKKDLPKTMKTEAPALPPETPGYDPNLTTSFGDDDE